MTAPELTIARAATLLRGARASRQSLLPFTDDSPELDETWAYDVQDELRRQHLATGERLIGAKLGLTSAAKQQRMGVDRPIVGFLTDAMPVAPDELAGAFDSWIQPRIEPEIAFVTSRDIDRQLDDVRHHVAQVLVAAEIIDSRWTGYRFRLADVVADNTSAAGLVLGETRATLDDVRDLTALRCEVEVDRAVVHRATGEAILGDPLKALQLLSAHLERRGEVLPAGSLVLAGALTDAVPLRAGSSYRLSVEKLGAISVSV